MKKHNSFWIGEQIDIPVRSYYRDEEKSCLDWLLPIFAMISIALTLILVLSSCMDKDPVYASEVGYSVEQIADAIYKAEGGAKTRHPYGILAKYKTTTPRQACINTIKHAQRDWNGQGDFIEFLSKRYAPIGAKNDPTGLNRNWLKNVRYFLGVSNA